jgi:flagellar biosynthesis protein FlhB
MVTPIYLNYLVMVGIAFVLYIILDLIYFKLFRVLRNLFQSLILAFSWLLMDKNVSMGIACFIVLILFGDYFYYRYFTFKKPQPKEKPNGTVL